MKTNLLVRICMIQIFSICLSNICAQDSTRIIILSDNIGPVISPEEKKEYSLLPQIKSDFVSAFYYLSEDSQYCCKVQLQKNNTVKDSLIILSYFSIKNTASRVQILDKVKSGKTYVIGEDFDFKYANGKEVEKILSETQTNEVRDFSAKQDSNIINEQVIAAEEDKTFLPIERTEINYSQFIEKNFYFGVSIGISNHSLNLGGLTKIFNQLEVEIPDSGYSLSKTNHKYKSSPVVRISSCLVISESILFELLYFFDLQGGGAKTVNLQGNQFSVGYMIPVYDNTKFQLSLSYAVMKFSATRNYYNTVTSEGGAELEKIELPGTAKGVNISGGILLTLSKYLAVKIMGGYNFFPNVSVRSHYNYENVKFPSIDPSGIELGLGLYVFNN